MNRLTHVFQTDNLLQAIFQLSLLLNGQLTSRHFLTVHALSKFRALSTPHSFFRISCLIDNPTSLLCFSPPITITPFPLGSNPGGGPNCSINFDSNCSFKAPVERAPTSHELVEDGDNTFNKSAAFFSAPIADNSPVLSKTGDWLIEV